MSLADPGPRLGKRCLAYCGDDACDCELNPRYQLPRFLPSTQREGPMAAEKKQINRTDSDFDQFDVLIYGTKIRRDIIVSADTEKGEIWCYQLDHNADKILPPAEGETEPPKELKVGTVTIQPRSET